MDSTYFKLWFVVGFALAAAIVFLSLTSSPPLMPEIEYGDKLSHLLAYATLTGWFGQLYTRLSTQIWIFITFCSMGVSLEFIQGMGEVRMFEYADMVANMVGVALGWWLTRTLLEGALLKVDRLLAEKFRC